MRVGYVIGNITLSHWHPLLTGHRLILALPASLIALSQSSIPSSEEIVILDQLHVHPEAWIGFSEGAEAAAPFFPEKKPIDAYVACLIDELQLHADLDTVQQLG